MLLSELLVKIAVEADTGKLKKFDSTLKAVGKAAGVVGAAIGAMAVGIGVFLDKNLTALDEIAQLSRVTGESAKQIQLLGKVAEVNGSSAEAAQASIAGLSRTIGEAANGVGLGAKAFEHYGLSAKKANGDVKTASEMMEEIRQKMKGLSEQQQIAMLAKLGIDASMIQTLRLSNEQMEAALQNAEALSLGTAENADEAAAFKDAMTEFWQIIKGVSEFVSLRLSPVVRELIAIFKQWFITNNQLIKGTLTKFVDKLSKVIRFISGFINALDRVISATIGWKNVIYLVGAAVAWLNRKLLITLATNPMLLAVTAICAALVGLIALIDDLIVYMQGGESYFGKAWEPVIKVIAKIQQKLEELQPIFALMKAWVEESIHYVIELFSGLWDYLSGLWDFLQGIFSGDGDLIAQGFTKMISGAIKVAKNFFNLMVHLVKASITMLGSVLSGLWQIITSPFRLAFKWVKAKWNQFTQWFSMSSLSEIFNTVIEIITFPFKAGFTFVKTLWDLFTGKEISVENVKENFAQVTDFIKKPFEAAFNWVTEKYDTYIKPIVEGVKGFFSSDKEGGGWFSGWFGGDKAEKNDLNPTALPAAGAVANNADNSVKNSNNKVTTNITLQSSGNPQQDAKLIANEVNRTIQNGQSSFAM
ncbi:phage tail protein [Avibacterium paragallinarum]|uniref:Phage-related protein n=1 Tax=Avibacterium paragallinarum TaxID=728 RepID=A0A380X8Y6_AVIPA|nr:phage tail tape measure protein [Avibacterium paragallinarum]AZI13542.1 hypothetical protein EIA51_02145 [Avibacterium paragallinarum]KAA6208766.1 phage tail tape measure protein [Avibacterium paragallinarum]QIR10864.1 phage tail tape measure protein [Avibacterium paragallinarum]QJE10284.1 phage tail tape measure protein [Avibacterium paragallinarum]QJE12478.1 phage tail tape measure protein [Avibacterium paragallinarum]